MKQQLNEVKKMQRLAGLIKENISERNYGSDVGAQELYPLMDDLSSLISTNSNLSTADKQAILPILSKMTAVIDAIVGEDEDDEQPVSDYGKRRQQDDKNYFGINEKEKPGLWANIRAKRERGEAPAKKGSKAYKSAVKAAKEINKNS
jgi:hypothetical protein